MNSRRDGSGREPGAPRLAGFVQQYVDYASGLSDAPVEYHIFAALTLLGASAARLRIAYGAQLLPASLWTVLVGRSAYYRKSTALEIARRVMAAVRADCVPPVIYDPEQVMAFLKESDRLVAVDDFADLLYAAPSRRLAELGDRGARLSLVAGATTSQLASRLSAADLSSGFMARFCFVLPGEKEKWLATPGQPSEQTERALAAMLKQAAALEGVAAFEEHRANLSNWGQTMVKWLAAHNGRRGLDRHIAAGLVSRTEPLLLKLAALLEISAAVGGARAAPPAMMLEPAASAGPNSGERGPGMPGQAARAPAAARTRASVPIRLHVSAESFANAVRLEAFLRNSFEALLARELGASNDAQAELRVLARISRQPGITRRRLQQNSHLDAVSLAQVLKRLNGNGRICARGYCVYPGDDNGGRQLAADSANG